MIFALVDYCQFAFRRGRYGSRQGSTMALAFEGTPPREVLDMLLPGDLFVTQRLDRWFSWAMMYFSSSPVDHCGICAGSRTVVHQTFGGVSEHPLRYVAKGARILILRPYDYSAFAGPAGPAETGRSRFYHRWPPKLQLAWGAVEVILGFFPERFRWRFLADLALIAALVDLAFRHVEPLPFALGLVSVLCCIALFNKARWTVRRLRGHPPPAPMSNPDAVLKLTAGALMFTTVGALVTGPFGVLPLAAVRAIARSSSSAIDAEPKEWPDWFRLILERLDIPPDDAPGSIHES